MNIMLFSHTVCSSSEIKILPSPLKYPMGAWVSTYTGNFACLEFIPVLSSKRWVCLLTFMHYKLILPLILQNAILFKYCSYLQFHSFFKKTFCIYLLLLLIQLTTIKQDQYIQIIIVSLAHSVVRGCVPKILKSLNGSPICILDLIFLHAHVLW